MTEQTRRGRRQLLLLATFFLGPLLLAMLIYYGGVWRPVGSTENGELLLPPLQLPDTALPGVAGAEAASFWRKWSLIMRAADGCGADCQAMLYQTRQVRKALGKERDRTQRVLLIAGPFDRAMLELQHPDLIIVTTDALIATDLAEILGADATEFVYLADPLGNLMMRFPRDTPMRDLHTDLKKLLKLSRIG
ncbi:MAG: hypothetical protein E2O52_00795 [Gammaproteobacteria bacterium]|nr:MAG: hypothetical protein E2O52_00795 [Gammaproteobacteria bacterium]